MFFGLDRSVGLTRAIWVGLGIAVTPAPRGANQSGALARVLPAWTWAEGSAYTLVPAGRSPIPRLRGDL